MPLTVIKGDLLQADEQIIVHQCNCVTSESKIVYTVEKYPYSNVYTIFPRVPGEVLITYPEEKGPIVVAFLAQYYPGRSRPGDSRTERLKWFRECIGSLAIFMKERGIDRVAFPFKIGCGLAGGIWEDYLRILEDFSKTINVIIYRKD